jgi:hypothetical protein
MPQRCSLGCGPSTECGRRRSFDLIGRPLAPVASTSRTDMSRRNPETTRLSSALVRGTPAPTSREANASPHPLVDGAPPSGGVDRGRAVRFAAPVSNPLAVAGAFATRGLGDLSLDGGLHQQAHPAAGALIQHLTQLCFGAEQVVYLGADGLTR